MYLISVTYEDDYRRTTEIELDTTPDVVLFDDLKKLVDHATEELTRQVHHEVRWEVWLILDEVMEADLSETLVTQFGGEMSNGVSYTATVTR